MTHAAPKMSGMHVLLVEDDPRMRRLVQRGLEEQGHQVDSAADGVTAGRLARASEYDVMVFDVMLPGTSGIDLVRTLRDAGLGTPVLLLTALDASADIIAGLDAGADDYLTKPFSFGVLLARVRALGRRAPIAHDVTLRVADLQLDSATRAVTRSGLPVTLTRTEFKLLECLMRRPGRVVTRDGLIERVWGTGREVTGNLLDAFVKSLRQKVDGNDRPRLIHTIRGVGFCVREDGEP